MSEDNDDRGAITAEVAREQASEFLGVFDGQDFDIGGGQTWHLPNPNYLPRDMKQRHLEYLRWANKDLDKETITDPITGKRRAQTVWPLQFNKKLIDEDELLCIALMGTDAVADREAYFKDGTLPKTYQRFIDAGFVAGQVQVHWRMMSLQMEERVKRDPKSR